jgi:outer membrane protein assembly factor BamA
MMLVLPNAARAQQTDRVGQSKPVEQLRTLDPASGTALDDAPTSVGGKPNSADPAAVKPRKRFEFVGAPMPLISPTLGNGLAAVAGVAVALDKDDEKAPPSLFGAGLMSTSNGTLAYGALAKLHLKHDKFRILAMAGKGNINYDYYGIASEEGSGGLRIPVSLNVDAMVLEPKVRVVENWFVGPRYLRLQSDVGLNLEHNSTGSHAPDYSTVDIRDLGLTVRSVAVGLRLLRDSRDSQFYPVEGSYFDTNLDFYRPAIGSNRSYENGSVSYQGYHKLKEKSVLAYRVSACAASGRVPFYSLCRLGQSKDIRGYAIGRYQDYRMLVGQVEYRRELFWRLGAAGFFGAGEVGRKFSEFNIEDIRPGGGVGLRFNLAPQNHINLRVDYAWGQNGNVFYLSVGEAF